MREVLDVLPQRIQEMVKTVSLLETEEIRIRMERPLEVVVKGTPHFLPYIVRKEDGVYVLNKLSQYSLYMMEEELKRGYVTIKGGHRVGLAGRVITENGNVKMIRDVTSFNIRIAREQIGIADVFLPYLYDGHWKNTMIVGPPQTGKTTLLRDFARVMSVGIKGKGIESSKVCIIDERSEIAGSVKGIPQYSFGTRLDVLDACPKAEGMMMMIRSMSPDVLVVDEIGRKEDSEAIIEAVHAGVQLMVTAHGYDYNDLLKRPSIRELVGLQVFQRFVILSRDQGPGTIKSIRDVEGKELYKKVGARQW